MTDHFLNDTWTVYFHDPNDNDWTEASYRSLFNVSTVEEFTDVHSQFKDAWNQGMFFTMREHIFPVWEDEFNKTGGCFSFKIMKPEVHAYWFKLNAMLLGETLIDRDKSPQLCGVSISPKRNFCILRIWVSVTTIRETMFKLPLPSYTKMMFKSYAENKDFNEVP